MENNSLLNALQGPLGRTLLQVAGSMIATKGWMDESSFMALAGAAMTLITTGFTVYSTHQRINAPKA